MDVKSRAMARFSIQKYFSHIGFFDESLLSEKYIDLCMETDMCSGADRAYKCMSNFFNEDESFCPIEKDVRFVIKLLYKMSKIIPQEFSAGILLMHLEIVEGLNP
jgi:hypothetical protein